MSISQKSARRSAARKARLKLHASERAAITMSPSTRANVGFKPLSDTDMQSIHRAALDLLENVGMAKPTPRVLEVALAHGCSQNAEGRLLFPRDLVERMVGRAAKSFIVRGRDPRFDFEAKNGQVNFCTGGAAVKMLDIDSGKYRSSTLRDLYDLIRLGRGIT